MHPLVRCVLALASLPLLPVAYVLLKLPVGVSVSRQGPPVAAPELQRTLQSPTRVELETRLGGVPPAPQPNYANKSKGLIGCGGEKQTFTEFAGAFAEAETMGPPLLVVGERRSQAYLERRVLEAT